MRFVIIYTVILGITGCSAIVTDRPTASHEIAVIPAPPGAGFVWVNESWRYNHKKHVYHQAPGHWEKPSKHNAVWVDGYWIQSPKGWRYVKGHWRK